jgi:hypothetical protein
MVIGSRRIAVTTMKQEATTELGNVSSFPSLDWFCPEADKSILSRLLKTLGAGAKGRRNKLSDSLLQTCLPRE